MTLPSARRISFAVRTTTAFMTSPFFTLPRGMASFTLTTIMSPTEAYFRLEPPSTLMHITRRAPELSATSRLVSCWIMTSSALLEPVPAIQKGSGLVRRNFPLFQLRNRFAFADLHDIANLRRFVLVVCMVLLRTTHNLLQERVLEAAFDIHHNRLFVFVADHDTLKDSLRHFRVLSSCLPFRRCAAAGSS